MHSDFLFCYLYLFIFGHFFQLYPSFNCCHKIWMDFEKTKQILTRLRVQKIVRSLNAVRNQYDKASKKSHSWPNLVLTNVVDWNDIPIFSSRSTGRRDTTKLKSVCRRRWWLTGQTLQRLGNLHFYKMMGMTQSVNRFVLSNKKQAFARATSALLAFSGRVGF